MSAFPSPPMNSGLFDRKDPASDMTLRRPRVRVAIIASLYPARMTAKRPGFKPQSFFEIAAAEDLNTPAVCVIQQQTENPYMGHGRAPDVKWEAEDVAADLVMEWGSGLPGGGGEATPAIWISEGARPGGNGDWIIPQAEIDFHRLRQDAVLKNLVQEARWFHGQKQDNAILPVSHKAAEWLNIEGEEWQKKLTSDARFKCGFCKSTCERGTIICPNCKQILDRDAFDAMNLKTHRTEMAFEGTAEPFTPPTASEDASDIAALKLAEEEMGIPPDEVAPRAKDRKLTAA